MTDKGNGAEGTNPTALQTAAPDWRIVMAGAKDFDDILKFMLGDFLSTEPMNECMGVKEEEAKVFFADIIRCALSEPIVSYVVRNNQGQIIAVRLSSLVRRSQPSDGAAFNAQYPSEDIGRICAILHELEGKIWSLVPADIDCLISWLVLSVDHGYKRRGIAQALLNHRVDELKIKLGCQGAVTEASAYNSQQLFRKLGYQSLFEILHSEWRDENGARIFKCRDSTDRVTLEFKRF